MGPGGAYGAVAPLGAVFQQQPQLSGQELEDLEEVSHPCDDGTPFPPCHHPPRVHDTATSLGSRSHVATLATPPQPLLLSGGPRAETSRAPPRPPPPSARGHRPRPRPGRSTLHVLHSQAPTRTFRLHVQHSTDWGGGWLIGVTRKRRARLEAHSSTNPSSPSRRLTATTTPPIAAAAAAARPHRAALLRLYS